MKNRNTTKSPLELGHEILEALRVENMGEVHAFVIFGRNICARLREIVGATNPAEAKPGTIRAMSHDSYEIADDEMRPVRNLVHCSEKEEEAIPEIINLMPQFAFLDENWKSEFACIM